VTFAIPDPGGRGLGTSQLGEALARLSPPQREELSEKVAGSLKARER